MDLLIGDEPVLRGDGGPRVRVIAEDGWIALDELVREAQLDSEHYRRCLADRIAWAVADAERRTTAGRPEAPPGRAADRALQVAA